MGTFSDSTLQFLAEAMNLIEINSIFEDGKPVRIKGNIIFPDELLREIFGDNSDRVYYLRAGGFLTQREKNTPNTGHKLGIASVMSAILRIRGEQLPEYQAYLDNAKGRIGLPENQSWRMVGPDKGHSGSPESK